LVGGPADEIENTFLKDVLHFLRRFVRLWYPTVRKHGNNIKNSIKKITKGYQKRASLVFFEKSDKRRHLKKDKRVENFYKITDE
jgi:hypothetical protein